MKKEHLKSGDVLAIKDGFVNADIGEIAEVRYSSPYVMYSTIRFKNNQTNRVKNYFFHNSWLNQFIKIGEL